MTTPDKSLRKRCSCPDCEQGGRPQPLTNFGINNSSPDGYHWYCKACNNAKQKKWKEANADKVRAGRKSYNERMKKRNRASRKQLELDLGE